MNIINDYAIKYKNYELKNMICEIEKLIPNQIIKFIDYDNLLPEDISYIEADIMLLLLSIFNWYDHSKDNEVIKKYIINFVNLEKYYELMAIYFAKDTRINFLEWFMDYTNINPYIFDNAICGILLYRSFFCFECKSIIKFMIKYNFDMDMHDGKLINSMININGKQILNYKIDEVELFLINGGNINLLENDKKILILVDGCDNLLNLVMNYGFIIDNSEVNNRINLLMDYGYDLYEIANFYSLSNSSKRDKLKNSWI